MSNNSFGLPWKFRGKKSNKRTLLFFLFFVVDVIFHVLVRDRGLLFLLSSASPHPHPQPPHASRLVSPVRRSSFSPSIRHGAGMPATKNSPLTCARKQGTCSRSRRCLSTRKRGRPNSPRTGQRRCGSTIFSVVISLHNHSFFSFVCFALLVGPPAFVWCILLVYTYSTGRQRRGSIISRLWFHSFSFPHTRFFFFTLPCLLPPPAFLWRILHAPLTWILTLALVCVRWIWCVVSRAGLVSFFATAHCDIFLYF